MVYSIGENSLLPSGKVVWPVLGGASDDPNDPAFTGEGGDEDDEDEDDDEEEDDKSKDKKSTKSKSKKESDDDDDEDDDEDKTKLTRPERQAARYRIRAREAEQKAAALEARLKAIEDKDKPKEEVVSQELSQARTTIEKLKSSSSKMTAQLAFYRTPTGITWADSADAFALADAEGLFEDVIDEDGTVDARELRRGLRDLAKRKPHLVKEESTTKASGRKDSDDDEEEPRSTRPMNGQRRGKKPIGPTRAELAKRFPVLNR